MPVGGGRGPRAELVEPPQRHGRELGALPPTFERVLARLEHDFAGRSVERDHLSGRDELGRAAQAHDRGHAERSREDHRVVRRTAEIGDEAAHARPVELRGERRRELVGDDDERRLELVDQVDERIAPGPQVALQAPADVGEIADALAQPVVALAREHFVELGDGALERPVAVDALGADELVGALGEQRIVEHQELRREDGRLRRADRARDTRDEISSSSTRVRSRAARSRWRSRSMPLVASR